MLILQDSCGFYTIQTFYFTIFFSGMVSAICPFFQFNECNIKYLARFLFCDTCLWNTDYKLVYKGCIILFISCKNRM